MTEINPQIIKEIILNARKPLVLKHVPLNWPCFKGGLEEWCKRFDESNFAANFERMFKNDCLEPQWERKREVIQLTAMQFLAEHSSKCCDYWSGLNYKRKHELPAGCTNGIDFTKFGFPEAADDFTLWLSSTNANTPCHYDSYGCNIVVQVFGKKSWHLFPPNTPLTSTRIPYEESSIYCKENFYFPNEELNRKLGIFKDVVHHVILEPNDILIVPRHWWHYVESVDISLSVNAWIPLKYDLEQQIDECIVKYLIESMVKNSSVEVKTFVINPNELANLTTNDQLFEILDYILKQYLKDDSNAKKCTNVYDYHYLSENKVEQLLKEIKGFHRIPLMATQELEHFLKPRNNALANISAKVAINQLEEILIDSICRPCVIETIRKEVLKRYQVY